MDTTLNKADTTTPGIIANANKATALYIVCMEIPEDPDIPTWTTRTINLFGSTDEVEAFTDSLDRKMKGKYIKYKDFTGKLLINCFSEYTVL